MANSFIVKGAQSLTEDLSFFKGFIIGCGEASAMVVDHIMTGKPISTQQLTQLIQDAANSGHLDYGMGQTAASVQWDMQHYAGVNSTVDYAVQSSSNIKRDIEAALAAGKPAIIGVNQGGQLTGEPASLHGHFITVVGENSLGYIVADPNTLASRTGGFVSDTLDELVKANPFAIITPTGSGPGTNPAGNPGGAGIPNPADAIGALTNALNPANIGQGIAQGFGSAFANIFEAPFKAIGVTNLKDFMTRAFLISIAVIFVIIGLLALFHTQISEFNSNEQQKAASAAAFV